MLKFLRNKAGYGLIETIISICVLSTITITSMTLLTNMMSSLEFFRSNVVAQTLATSKVNMLNVTKYDNVVAEARAQVDTTYKLDREVLVNEITLGDGTKEKDITINIYKSGAADKLFTMNYTAGAAASSAPPTGKTGWVTPGTYSWTCPQGVTTVWVTMAGGGGGASGTAYDYGGGGGGGGATVIDKPITVVPGTTYTITVGKGGAGSSSGSGGNGTASSFGTLFTCPGGGGGIFGGMHGTDGAFGVYLLAMGGFTMDLTLC